MWESSIFSSLVGDRYTWTHQDKKQTKNTFAIIFNPSSASHLVSPWRADMPTKACRPEVQREKGGTEFLSYQTFIYPHPYTFIRAHSWGAFKKETPIQSRQRLSHLDPKLKVAGQETTHAVQRVQKGCLSARRPVLQVAV